MRAGRSLARQLLVLQLLVVLITVAIGGAIAVVTAQRRAQDQQRERVLSIAQTLAQEPTVADALDDPRPQDVLQPLAESVRRRTDASFVVVMSRDGIRYSHPNPDRIGQRFVGHIGPAQRGHAFTETYRGTLGASVRAVVPVLRDGRVAGLVAVGVLEARVAAQLRRQLPGLLALTAVALLIGAALSLLLARRVRRQTLGLEPREIATMYEHHDAALHAIREGLVMLDRQGRLLMANDEACRLLDLRPNATGRPLADVMAPGPLRDLLLAARPATDEPQIVGGRVLVVNQRPATVRDRLVGTVTTLRDRTELVSLAQELDAVQSMAGSLRAQAHESANQLHTVVGLVELGRYEDAVEFATERATAAQELLERLQSRIAEPALVALLLGKAATAQERGVLLEVSDDTRVGPLPLPASALVTIVGNLVDNAVDACWERPGARVTLALRSDAGALDVEVRDNGPGIAEEDLPRVFEPGWSTKGTPEGRGLGLALVRQVVRGLGGTVEAANDGGAVFSVHVPLGDRETAAAP